MKYLEKLKGSGRLVRVDYGGELKNKKTISKELKGKLLVDSKLSLLVL